VEGNEIAEERILVEEFTSSVTSTVTFVVASKQVDDSVLDIFSDVGQVHLVSTSGRTFTIGDEMFDEYEFKLEAKKEKAHILKFEP
jgi:hypothetical protein